MNVLLDVDIRQHVTYCLSSNPIAFVYFEPLFPLYVFVPLE
jgi:hypothetical protein